MKLERGWAYPDADVFMAAEMRDDGTYQAAHLQAALAYVTEWSVAVDGGAHVGTWAKMLAERFAKVIAVEPSSDTFTALSVNMASFACANVDCRNVALGAVAGSVSLHLDPKDEARQNTGGRYVRDGGSIARETLDSWHLPTLGFLKLDVEGSEPLVLMGARATLTRCRPIVLFENKRLWTRYGLRADAPHAVLRQAGYRLLRQVGADDIWGPV